MPVDVCSVSCVFVLALVKGAEKIEFPVPNIIDFVVVATFPNIVDALVTVSVGFAALAVDITETEGATVSNGFVPKLKIPFAGSVTGTAEVTVVKLNDVGGLDVLTRPNKLVAGLETEVVEIAPLPTNGAVVGVTEGTNCGLLVANFNPLDTVACGCETTPKLGAELPFVTGKKVEDKTLTFDREVSANCGFECENFSPLDAVVVTG